jgi:probable rRNA maturation factor
MKAVQFFYFKSIPGFRNRTRLKEFILRLIEIEQKQLAHLSVIFCTDKFLLEMNKSYLGHDFYTDVITFDLSRSAKSIEGEIYISVDRVKDNAIRFNASFSEELHRVIIHGLLHLCGYKDKLKSHRAQMRDKEDRYLNMYFSKGH